MSHTINRSISITGLGYVGLPIAIAFDQTMKVIGFDVNQSRIDELKNGIDRTGEVKLDMLRTSNISFTSDFNELSKANFHIITVPTPIDDAKKPNLKPLLSASKTVGKILKKGDIVVYESTVYPGVTEDECAPILESQSGLKCGKDFFLGYSPERINPGDKKNTLNTIVKIISAQDQNTLNIIADVYSLVVDAGLYKAPSIKVAEAAKVIENIQRDLNIALINELAILFKKMNIDTHDVLDAASTKWNFLSFEPGLVGGHCIGVDPYYLTYKSTLLGYEPEVILAGRKINNAVGKYITDTVINNLKAKHKDLSGVVVTVLGVTFKENIPDIRNTKVLDILMELEKHPMEIQIYDPYVDSDEFKNQYKFTVTELNNIKESDAIILAVPHSNFVEQGWELISKLVNPDSCIVFDVKSILKRSSKPKNIELFRL
jgi:UDP-N-acetyl-D-galactosamine dehydrogenase